jgi:hypothetical protein
LQILVFLSITNTKERKEITRRNEEKRMEQGKEELKIIKEGRNSTKAVKSLLR